MIRTYTNKNFTNSNLNFNKTKKPQRKFREKFIGNYEIANGECLNDYNCFLPYGVCLNKTACLCMPDFANVYVKENSLENIKCTYRKKKASYRRVIGIIFTFIVRTFLYLPNKFRACEIGL